MKIPDSVQDVTITWLTEALRTKGLITQASVATFDTKIIDDTQGATGQLARLSLTYDAQETNAPSSLVAKFSSTNPAQREQLRVNKFYEREVRFYEQLASQIDLRTPACYYSAIDLKTGQSVLLLEDLTGGRNIGKFGDCSAEEAELAINQIAKLHAVWWESPRLNEMDWIRQDDDRYRHSQHSYQQCRAPFLERVGHALPEPMLEIGPKFGQVVAKVLRYLAGSPRTLTHGDYQPSNLFFFTAPNGDMSLVLFDWQLINLGRGVRDVARFLARNVPSELRRTQELVWLKMYHDRLVEYGVEDYSFDICLHDYRLSTFISLLYIVSVIGGGLPNQKVIAANCQAALPRLCTAIIDSKAEALLADEWL